MDGLRAVAAVLVLMVHTGSILAPVDVRTGGMFIVMELAHEGVTVFFALSGFLLFMPFVMAILGERPSPSIGKFLSNRALRIYPAYLVIFVIVCFVVGAAYQVPYELGGDMAKDAVAIGRLSDPALIGLDASLLGNLFPMSMQTGLSVSWTLTVEISFYLALPLLAWAARCGAQRGRARLFWAAMPAAVLLAIGVCGKVLLAMMTGVPSASEAQFYAWGNSWVAVFSRSIAVNCDMFAFGMLAALTVALFKLSILPSRYREAVRWVALAAGAIAVVVMRKGTFSDTGWSLLFGAIILFLALNTRRDKPGHAARLLESAPIRYVGKLSYSLYLWHLPVIWVLRNRGLSLPNSSSGFWVGVMIVLIISLCLSAVTYELVERQALKFKRSSTGARPEFREPARTDPAS